MAVQRGPKWLAAATPEQIDAAYRAGELESMLTGDDVADTEAPSGVLQHDQAWVDAATPEAIAEAFQAGELDVLLGKLPPVSNDPQKPAQGLYGDGAIVTHQGTPRGDIPQVIGAAVVIPSGVDPKDA